MRLLAALVLAAVLPGADTSGIPGPWALRTGVAVASDGVRSLTRQEGLFLGAGLIVPQRGLVGRLGGDVDWRATWGNGSRFDALSAVYIERWSVGNGVFAGLGGGLGVLRLFQPGRVDTTIRPTAKGTIGATLPWKPPAPARRLAVEAAGLWTDQVAGVPTWGVLAGLTVGF